MTKRTSLADFLADETATLNNGSDLAELTLAVAAACVEIADLVRYGELAGVLGAAGQENVQGEEQKKLDIIANDVFIKHTEGTGQLAGIASEEMDEHYPIPEGMTRGNYLITVDPLDGSSNIDVNGATGTIFSVLPYAKSDAPSDDDFLQAGNQQVIAGYCLYSSATMLVLTFGRGTHGFTLDLAAGEFVLSHPNMQVPKKTQEFSINAAYAQHWHSPIKRYIDECVSGEEGPRKAGFNMRWAGSMVGDVHRILCRGGVFLYPWLMQQAGGSSHTGVVDILDVPPTSLHQRVPVMLGSSSEIDRLVDYHSA